MYKEDRDNIIAGITKLNEAMCKLIALKDQETDVTPEILDIRCKTIKHMTIEVDNSLSYLRDFLDAMEAHGDEHYDASVKLVNELERNAEVLIEYLRSVGKY